MTNLQSVLRELAEAVIEEHDKCVGEEGPSWTLREQAQKALDALRDEPSGDWQPIETAPLEKFILLWWVGDGTPEPTATYGMISEHQRAMYWNGGQYVPLKHVTHWRPLPTDGPSRLNRSGES